MGKYRGLGIFRAVPSVGHPSFFGEAGAPRAKVKARSLAIFCVTRATFASTEFRRSFPRVSPDARAKLRHPISGVAMAIFLLSGLTGGNFTMKNAHYRFVLASAMMAAAVIATGCQQSQPPASTTTVVEKPVPASPQTTTETQTQSTETKSSDPGTPDSSQKTTTTESTTTTKK